MSSTDGIIDTINRPASKHARFRIIEEFMRKLTEASPRNTPMPIYTALACVSHLPGALPFLSPVVGKRQACPPDGRLL